MISILAESYAKGCKIYSIKEKKLDAVFDDGFFPFPDDKEALKNECREYLKKKGGVYAVYFKKKLIGLYVLRCENLDLILTHQISYNMEDIVKAEVEKTIKLLVHAKVVNGKFDRAVWNEEIIDKDYVNQGRQLWYFWLMILILNVTVLVINIVNGGHWLTTLCISATCFCYLFIIIGCFKRK